MNHGKYQPGLANPTDEEQLRAKSDALKPIFINTCKAKGITFAQAAREIENGNLTKELTKLRRSKNPKLDYRQLEAVSNWIKNNQ